MKTPITPHIKKQLIPSPLTKSPSKTLTKKDQQPLKIKTTNSPLLNSILSPGQTSSLTTSFLNTYSAFAQNFAISPTTSKSKLESVSPFQEDPSKSIVSENSSMEFEEMNSLSQSQLNGSFNTQLKPLQSKSKLFLVDDYDDRVSNSDTGKFLPKHKKDLNSKSKNVEAGKVTTIAASPFFCGMSTCVFGSDDDFQVTYDEILLL